MKHRLRAFQMNLSHADVIRARWLAWALFGLSIVAAGTTGWADDRAKTDPRTEGPNLLQNASL